MTSSVQHSVTTKVNKTMPPPKFNKLTNNKTGKLKKISPPAPVNIQEASAEESAQQFDLEIFWCVQQLELSLQPKNLTQKQGNCAIF